MQDVPVLLYGTPRDSPWPPGVTFLITPSPAELTGLLGAF